VLLLASASPARRRLLEQAAIPHRVQVSGVDEDAIHHADPAQLVQLLAQAKAQAVRDACTDASITAVLGPLRGRCLGSLPMPTRRWPVGSACVAAGATFILAIA